LALKSARSAWRPGRVAGVRSSSSICPTRRRCKLAYWHISCERTDPKKWAIADRDTVAAGPRTRVRAFNRADVDAWQAWPDYPEKLLVGTSPRRMSPDQRGRWFEDITQRQRQLPFAVEDESGEMIGRIFLRHVRHEERSAGAGHRSAIPISSATATGPSRWVRSCTTTSKTWRSTACCSASPPTTCAPAGVTSPSASRTSARTGTPTWDPTSAPSRCSGSVRHLFRRGPLGLESLFYDMRLERGDWLSRR